MTSSPSHEDPPPVPQGVHHAGGAMPEHDDAWQVLSETEHPGAEEIPADEVHPALEPVRRSRIWPRVVGVLILLVGVGGGWIWENPGSIQRSLPALFPKSANQNVDLAAIGALEARVARLEQQPGGAVLAARLDALEKRETPTPPPPVDLGPLLARLDALEARSRGTSTAGPAATPTGGAVTDLSPLTSRLDGLAAAQKSDAAKISALAAQIGALPANGADSEFRGKLDELSRQLSNLSANQTRLAETSDHAMRTGRLDAASIALASGRPLGLIPDAPPALARFANAAPPTEPGLRLSFDAASQAALKVSQPDTGDKPFLDRVLARLQDSRLITVREGDRVVVGNSAAAILVHARALLDAGDLDGAVKAVSSLTGPPAEKMAAWLTDAKSLQEAREALAALQGTG
jgi:Mitochondrial inner membrane protein